MSKRHSPKPLFDRVNPRHERGRDGKRDHGKPKAAPSGNWLFGAHAVEAALLAGKRTVHEVLLVGDATEFQTRHPSVRVRAATKHELDKQFTGQVHQGIAARVDGLPELTLEQILETEPELIVALDQVTDPHNLGAIMRSCAAFGVAAVLVTEHRSAHVSPVVAKAAAGALETVPLVNVGNLAQALMKITDGMRMQVVGLAGEATEEISAVKPGPVCLVLGSEGEGLRRLTRERCDMLVKIPMPGEMESLNVSVAGGVSLYALSQR